MTHVAFMRAINVRGHTAVAMKDLTTAFVAVRRKGLKLYVAFLAQKPRGKVAFPVRSAKERLEAIAMNGREVFIISANGNRAASTDSRTVSSKPS